MFCFQPFIRLIYPDHIKRKQRHRGSLRLRIYLATAGSWKTLRLTIGSAAAAGFQKRLFQIFLRINVTFLLWSVEPPPILASKLQLTAAAQYLAPSLFARAPMSGEVDPSELLMHSGLVSTSSRCGWNCDNLHFLILNLGLGVLLSVLSWRIF